MLKRYYYFINYFWYKILRLYYNSNLKLIFFLNIAILYYSIGIVWSYLATTTETIVKSI